MKELTPEQEDLINDCHEKRLREELEKEEREKEKHKVIPIKLDRIDKILKIIGRKKLDDNENYCDLKKIKEEKVNER